MQHGLNPFDGGKVVDWGKTSADYGQHRPGPPDSFYARLNALGVGLSGQSILDLGTGTGLLARRFARDGATVAGVDISEGQIDMARALAQKENLNIDFRVSGAEKTSFDSGTFDVITASQCWFYFRQDEALAEVKRLLKPNGVLVTAHFSWLPRLDKTAAMMEALVKKYNPDWSSNDWDGNIPPMPKWAIGTCDLRAMFYYDEPIPFTRESWCGRIRACRGVGAALPELEVKRFDAEHMKMLEQTVPPQFTVLHRIDAHILQPL